MTVALALAVHEPARAGSPPAAPWVLQRSHQSTADLLDATEDHCACGGECPDCRTASGAGLPIGPPDDAFEREAEAVAERVTAGGFGPPRAMTARGPAVQRTCSCGGTPRAGEEECEECASGQLRRSPTAAVSTPVAPPLVHSVIARPGQALAGPLRESLESRLGFGLGDVRIHADAAAAASAGAVGAAAYTVGHHVVFGAGRFAPHTTAGRHLLAHELTHVHQQIAGPVMQPIVQRQEERHPARAARPPTDGLYVWVTIDKPMSGEEFCVTAMAQATLRPKAEVRKLIETKEWHCVNPKEVTQARLDGLKGQPIPFFIWTGKPTGKRDAAAEEAWAKMPAEERQVVNAEADARFREQTGVSGPLSQSPRDAAYREQWLRHRESVIHELHPTDEDKLQQALNTPKMKRFMASRSAGGPAYRALQPGEVKIALELAGQVEQLDEESMDRFDRVKAPWSGTWAESLAGVQRLTAAQQQDRDIAARVSGRAGLYGKVKKVEALVNERVMSSLDPTRAIGNLLDRDESEARLAQAVHERDDALQAAGFRDLDVFNKAAGQYREIFQTHALEFARDLIRRIRTGLWAERDRYHTKPGEAQALYGIAHSGVQLTDDLVKRFPILGVDPAWDWATRAGSPSYLADRMGLRALERLANLDTLENHLKFDPDLVFKLTSIVKMTEKELHSDATQTAMIAEERGKPTKDKSWLDWLLDIDLFFLSILSGPAGWIIGGTQVLLETASRYSEYEVLSTAFEEHATEVAPSKWEVAKPLVTFVAVPAGLHGAGAVWGKTTRWLSALERESGALDTAAEEAALVNEPATPDEPVSEGPKADPEAPAETGAVEPKAEPATTPEPQDDVAIDVGDGHHVEITDQGVEFCSPKPCKLLDQVYKKELEQLPQLAAYLKQVKKVATRNRAAAARMSARLERTLKSVRANPDLFDRLPATATAQQANRLAPILEAASEQGTGDLGTITSRVEQTTTSAGLDNELRQLEQEFLPPKTPRGKNITRPGKMTEEQFKQAMKPEPGQYVYVIEAPVDPITSIDLKVGVAKDPYNRFNQYVLKDKLTTARMRVYPAEPRFQALAKETAGISERLEMGEETLNVRHDTRWEVRGGETWGDELEQPSSPWGKPLITIGREGSWPEE